MGTRAQCLAEHLTFIKPPVNGSCHEDGPGDHSCSPHSFTHSLVHSFTCLLIHSLIHSFTHPFVHSFVHSSIRSLIHSFPDLIPERLSVRPSALAICCYRAAGDRQRVRWTDGWWGQVTMQVDC